MRRMFPCHDVIMFSFLIQFPYFVHNTAVAYYEIRGLQWELGAVVIRDKLIYDLCYEEGQWNCAVFSLLAKTTESLWCQLRHWRHRDEYQIIYNHNNPRQIANICIVTDMHLTWYVENRHRFRMFFNTYISGLNSIRPGHTHISSDPCIIHNKYITLKSTS